MFFFVLEAVKRHFNSLSSLIFKMFSRFKF